jgi:hypothetical protein
MPGRNCIAAQARRPARAGDAARQHASLCGVRLVGFPLGLHGWRMSVLMSMTVAMRLKLQVQ